MGERMRAKLFVTAVLNWVVFTGTAVAELPPEARQVMEKAGQLKNYRARFTLEAREAGGEPLKLEGTILCQPPNCRAMELKPLGSREEPQKVISNGQVEWQYVPETRTAYRIPNPAPVPGPHRPFSEAKEETLRFTGVISSEQGSLLRFEAQPREESVDGAPVPVRKIRVDVSEQDGLVRELTLLDAQGEAVMTQRFSDVQVNVPTAEKDFNFTPKQGMAVVDLEKKEG